MVFTYGPCPCGALDCARCGTHPARGECRRCGRTTPALDAALCDRCAVRCAACDSTDVAPDGRCRDCADRADRADREDFDRHARWRTCADRADLAAHEPAWVLELAGAADDAEHVACA